MNDIKRLERLNKKHTERAIKQCSADMLEFNSTMEGMDIPSQKKFATMVMSAAYARMECMRFLMGVADPDNVKTGKNDAVLAKTIRDMAEELASGLEKEHGQ